MGIGTVEHQRHVIEFLLLVEVFQVGQLTAVQLAGTDDEHGEVGNAVGNGGVGNDAHGHTVGNDIVVALAKLVHQLVEALVHEQLSRIGRHGARHNHIHVLVVVAWVYDLVHGYGRIRQIVGYANLALADVVAEGVLANVKVHQHHTLLGIDKAHGQIACDKGLAGALVEAGEGDDLHGLVLLGHEGHVGAQDAEGLGHHVVVLFADHHLLLSALGLLLFLVLRNLAQEGYADGSFHILSAMNAGVQEQDHEEDYTGEGYAHQYAQKQDAVAVRTDGRVATGGTVYDTGIVVGHGLGEGVLLPAIEEEQVKRLLDFLLALYALHLSFLGGDGHHAALRPLLAALCIVAAHIEAEDVVVHRAYDGLFHGTEAVVELLHHGIALTAVVNELVPAQLHGIVLADLAFNAGVADTGIGGDEVYLLGRVSKIALDVLGQFQLGFQFLAFRTVLLCLAHVLSGSRSEVDNLVALLERLHGVLHSAQFLFNDDETFVNEVGGVDGHLVLVLDGGLVIHLNEGVQHILGTSRRAVLDGEGKDGRFLALLTDAYAAKEVAHHAVQRHLLHQDVHILPGIVIEIGGCHHHLALLQGHGLVHTHGLATDRFAIDNLLYADMLLVHGRHIERHVCAGQCIGEAYLDRRLGIELNLAEAVGLLVTDISIESFNHIGHQLLGAELQQFVGHIDLVDEVVITVKSCRGCLVGGVLDDNRCLAEIDKRRRGILQPRQPAEDQYGEQEPLPLGQKIHEQVEHIQLGLVLFSLIIHCTSLFLLYTLFILYIHPLYLSTQNSEVTAAERLRRSEPY